MADKQRTNVAKQSEQTKSLTHTRLCGHPELHPTQWGEAKPAPAFMIGCIHDHSCPVCGFGQGMHPHSRWDCPDKLGEVTDLANTSLADSTDVSNPPVNATLSNLEGEHGDSK